MSANIKKVCYNVWELIIMSKMKFKIKLESSDENLDFEVNGIKNKNKINYKEFDVSVTLLINENKVTMKRVCNDYTINLVFVNNCETCSTYSVFGGTKIFNLSTFTNSIKISENKIIIDYNLEGNKFFYILEMEELDGIK